MLSEAPFVFKVRIAEWFWQSLRVAQVELAKLIEAYGLRLAAFITAQ
jgi:hypothetical protein